MLGTGAVADRPAQRGTAACRQTRYRSGRIARIGDRNSCRYHLLHMRTPHVPTIALLAAIVKLVVLHWKMSKFSRCHRGVVIEVDRDLIKITAR